MADLTVEQALEYPGPVIAVWHSDAVETLLVCATGAGKLDLLAFAKMDRAAREAKTAELKRRGVRIGFTDGTSPIYWSNDGGFTVWARAGLMADSVGQDLELRDGQLVRRSEVARVYSFFDDDSYGHRGVKVVRKDGKSVVVVEEDSALAQLDPTYGLDNASLDSAWASHLGRDLAEWFGAPHKDETP